MDEEDCIRVDEFRQLKREIRGSERHLIIGIDVAKEKGDHGRDEKEDVPGYFACP